ncbi:MAG: VWA domain-containing protein [Verrucomicrobiota bacterium]|jgi:Ca-activated chloride channel family protein|nr:VWA domain-containing protein [Verrucomicrobiota bacterium]MDD8051639.1 VWA domain-containing protein [Verrucomicrobiota bacterium]
MKHLEFHDLWVLGLLIIPLVYALRTAAARRPALSYSSLFHLEALRRNWVVRTAWAPRLLTALGLTLCILGLARPRAGKQETQIRTEGVDIVLAVDVSGSMIAHDFALPAAEAASGGSTWQRLRETAITSRNSQIVDRLTAAKAVIRQFVQKRPNDRIALVAFAGRAYTLCPPTLDHGWLLSMLERAEIGMIEDGTAIGSAIGTSVNRLRESTAKSRIVVLLTDGSNNVGEITPAGAAQAAKALGIKVYAVAAGAQDYAPIPGIDLFGKRIFRQQYLPIDMATLQSVAEITGAKAYRASDTENLSSIYDEIDQLETSEIEIKKYLDYHELFTYLLAGGLLLLGLAQCMSRTRWEVLPA